MELPHLAVGPVLTATRAVFAQLQALRIAAAVLGGSIVALPAVAALQGDDLSDVGSLSGHS